MARPNSREAALAAEFERLAAALRRGDATVYGYRVEDPPQGRERGAVAYDGRWLTFELDRSRTES